MCEVAADNNIGIVEQIRTEFVQSFFVHTSGLVQVKLCGCVDDSFLHREDIRPHFEFFTVRSQEVTQRKLGLTHSKHYLLFTCEILVAIMNEDPQELGS